MMKFPNEITRVIESPADLQQFSKESQTDLFLLFMKVTLMDILTQDQKETTAKETMRKPIKWPVFTN